MITIYMLYHTFQHVDAKILLTLVLHYFLKKSIETWDDLEMPLVHILTGYDLNLHFKT